MVFWKEIFPVPLWYQKIAKMQHKMLTMKTRGAIFSI